MKKVLICGDVKGDFAFLYSKVLAFQQKGQNFDLLLCVGETLSPKNTLQMYLSLELPIPIPTYFIDCSLLSASLNNLYPNGKEIVKDLHFLGRSGLKTIQNLRIAFLSGRKSDNMALYQESNQSQIKNSGPFYTLADILQLEAQVYQLETDPSVKGIDLLLTNEWPHEIEKFSATAPDLPSDLHSTITARVNFEVAPRYHFSATQNKHFQREPFKNRKNYHTNFIALASLRSKEKYLNAFQLLPIDLMAEEELFKSIEVETKNPFEQAPLPKPLTKVTDILNQEIQIIEDELETEQDNIFQLPKETHKELPKEVEKLEKNEELFFSGFDHQTNDDDIYEFLTRWGQISKYELVYDERGRHRGFGFVQFRQLEVANKALAQTETFTLHGKKIKFGVQKPQIKDHPQFLGCWFCFHNEEIDQSLILDEKENFYLALDKGPILPDHCLIIPKDHFDCSIHLDSQKQEEMQRYQEEVIEFFKIQKDQGVIIFERTMRAVSDRNHMIRQVIPLANAELFNFCRSFEKLVHQDDIEFFKLEPKETVAQFVTQNELYFYLEVVSYEITERYLFCYDQSVNFPQDFGRQIICEILSIDRQTWRKCVLDFNQISKAVTQFISQLKKYRRSQQKKV